ncbi:MAG TPA: hypothetical protein VF752_01525 [Thermoleophilaceae bacterium]
MAETRPGARQHRVLVASLLALAFVVGLVASLSLWANRQALNTDNWVDTSSRLLADQKIQQAVGAYLVDELFSSVDVSAELQQVLPPRASALAGPAAAGLRDLADRAAPRLLDSPRAQTYWENANRTAHKELLAILNGGGKNVSTQNGEVVLNLHGLVNQLATGAGLSQSQVNAARGKVQGGAGAKAQKKLGVTLPPSSGELVILRSDQLSAAQDVADAIRHLAFWLTGIFVALCALAVWFARGWRRVALRRVGWSFVALGVLVLFARRVGGNELVDTLVKGQTVKPAAHDAWNIGTSLLYDIGIAAVAYGVAFVFAAWLAGPTVLAVGARRALASPLRYSLPAVYAVVAFLYLLLLLWGPTPALRKPIGILLFAVLIVLGVELLRRQTAREFPDAQPGDTAARIRRSFAERRGRGRAATDERDGFSRGGVDEASDEASTPPARPA